MTSKVKGSEGIEFPDATVQSSAAFTKEESKVPVFYAGTTLQTYIAAIGTWTKCTYNSEIRDTANAYDPATSRFTAPKSGYYIFMASIRSSLQTVGACLLGFGIDGGNAGSWAQIPNNGQAATISTVFALNAGQTVEVQALLQGPAVAGDIGLDFAFAHFNGAFLRGL